MRFPSLILSNQAGEPSLKTSNGTRDTLLRPLAPRHRHSRYGRKRSNDKSVKLYVANLPKGRYVLAISDDHFFAYRTVEFQ